MNRILALGLVALLLLVSGCGSDSKSTSTAADGATTTQSSQRTERFATTKFVLHAGLAFGAFHRYIYKPYKANAFDKSNSTFKRIRTFTKAALAGVFTIHEVKVAAKDARQSKVLAPLAGTLTALADKLAGIATGLQGGKFDPTSLDGANDAITEIVGKAKQVGVPVADKVPSSFAPVD